MSKKIHLPERINLTEEGRNSLIINCKKVAKELKNTFANAVKNLNIPNYENCDSLVENIDDPTKVLNVSSMRKWGIWAKTSK